MMNNRWRRVKRLRAQQYGHEYASSKDNRSTMLKRQAHMAVKQLVEAVDKTESQPEEWDELGKVLADQQKVMLDLVKTVTRKKRKVPGVISYLSRQVGHLVDLVNLIFRKCRNKASR